MRVLFWSESFWPSIGGSELFATTLIDHLRTDGHEFSVITTQPAGSQNFRSDYEGVPICRLPITEAIASDMDVEVIVPARKRVAQIHAEFQPDLLHISLPGPSLIAGFSLVVEARSGVRGKRLPILVSTHVPFEPTVVVFERPAYQVTRLADWVTAPSRALRDHVRWMLPEIRGRDSIIPNGLPVPRVAPKSQLRDPHVLLVASRLVEQKGIGTALSAFAQVCRRRSDVRLVIAGDGPLRGDLVTMSERLEIEDKVDFIGWIDPGSVPDLINEATAVLIPSEHESFGLSALEAMRMARPVVASCVDGLPEIVEHGVTGLLFNPGDSTEMAENIEGLLGNPELAESMGQAGRERALRDYSSATMGDRFAALYERLTSQNAGFN